MTTEVAVGRLKLAVVITFKMREYFLNKTFTQTCSHKIMDQFWKNTRRKNRIMALEKSIMKSL